MSKASYLEQIASLFRRHRRDGAPAAPGQEPGHASAPGPSRQHHLRRTAPFVGPAGDGHAERSAADHRNLQEFEARLRQVGSPVGSMSGLVAGRVHMLNTDKVRERLGDRWPRFEHRIHHIIKTELTKRLGEHDLFTKANDCTYVIVFGDCSELEARVRVALLSEQILEKILGEAEAKELGALGVERMVVQADGRVAAEAAQSTDALMRLLDQAQTEIPQPATYRSTDVGAGRRALSAEESARLLGGVGAAAPEDDSDAPIVKIDELRRLIRGLEGLEDAMPVVAYPAHDRVERTQSTQRATQDRDVPPVFERTQLVRERANRQIVFLYDHDPQKSETPATSSSAPEVEFTYLPMWHAPSQKVGVYLCSADVLSVDGASLPEWRDGSDAEADLLAVVDRLTLRRVQDDIGSAWSQGEPNILAVPVHFSTLQAQRHRNKLFDLCRRMPEDHRSLLIWEIIGAHYDAWSLQLPELFRQMKLFGRAVFLRLEGVEDHLAELRRHLPHLRSAGIHAIGVDVSKLHGSESRKLHLLEQLAERADDNGLKYYGHGFRSLSMTICAVCMGYQHVSGPAIADAVARPEGIRGTAMETIYKRVMLKNAAVDTP